MTGVQTCALPISRVMGGVERAVRAESADDFGARRAWARRSNFGIHERDELFGERAASFFDSCLDGVRIQFELAGKLAQYVALDVADAA